MVVGLDVQHFGHVCTVGPMTPDCEWHDSAVFSGWPRAAFDFYAGLEVDNSRAYFQAHRADYDEAVKAPFLDLSTLVEHEFGPLHVFRPHRDVRFARQEPVQDGRGCGDGRPRRDRVLRAGLGGGAHGRVGLLHALPRPARAVARCGRRPGRQRRSPRAVDSLRARRYEVGAHETLKTAPRGYSRDHPRVELLRMKGITVGRSFAPARWLHTHRGARPHPHRLARRRAREPLARPPRRAEHDPSPRARLTARGVRVGRRSRPRSRPMPRVRTRHLGGLEAAHRRDVGREVSARRTGSGTPAPR